MRTRSSFGRTRSRRRSQPEDTEGAVSNGRALRRNIASMSKLIRMDHTGHSTLAEWTEDNPEACQAAIREFRRELEQGCIGMVTDGPGKATQVRELPLDADLVILRRPIAGG